MTTHAYFLAIHAFFLVLSVWLGGHLVGWHLKRLKIYNDHVTAAPSGPTGVGRAIGWAERFMLYVAITTEQPEWIAVVFALKTIVRYPEIQASAKSQVQSVAQTPRSDASLQAVARPSTVSPADAAHVSTASLPTEPGSRAPAGTFAEYYLVGTLTSLAFGITAPLIAIWFIARMS